MWCYASLWDKANVFGRSDELVGDTVTTGTPLNEPPLIDMISNDPVLRGVKVSFGLLFILKETSHKLFRKRDDLLRVFISLLWV